MMLNLKKVLVLVSSGGQVVPCSIDGALNLNVLWGEILVGAGLVYIAVQENLLKRGHGSVYLSIFICFLSFMFILDLHWPWKL